MGSWKINEIWFPRIFVISRSDFLSKSCWLKKIFPFNLDPNGVRPIIADAVIDFPDPLSPNNP